MDEVLAALHERWAAGEPAGLATVVATWHSAPRQPGAAMLVAADGTVTGSVSGGCVEGDLYEVAGEVRDTGRAVLRRYGVSDDDAFAVGLTCGGILDVYVERVDRAAFPALPEVTAAIADGRPVAVATVVADRCAGAALPDERPGAATAVGAGLVGRRLIVWPDATPTPEPRAESGGPGPAGNADGPGPTGRDTAAAPPAGTTAAGRRLGTLGSARLDDAVTDDARGLLAAGRTGTLTYGHDGQRRGDDLTVFVASHAPRPRMIVFGAIDFAAAVARTGAFLGYRVTVCDARGVFATRARFPDADEVVVEWPHRYLAAEAAAGRLDGRTVVCVLTHDPKFDVPVLTEALRLPLAYVGAMGSRRTHDDRLARLREAGLTGAELARLASPIGLDIGARTPEETAVSVAAEIVSRRWRGTGSPLSATSGRIHH
ncbi:xanthine dehydrogenase [Actinocatenispora thailandica]|uniref:Xanthine dehydrogenase n=1 Tax=Actinocatenispora thailandica TaxID=227318 RepID=A0A7R7DVD2_9ACTN|nr:XdhC/CoxI family protein [Actinocatenispora thailandica]BCJ38547.1 xanthine dehydrogenase [Actinocatenispora thailandica]